MDVFGGINKRLRGVGLCSVACGYIGVTYYSMLLSWVAHAFVDSFGKDNVWADQEVTGSEAAEHFEQSIIGMETLPDDLKPTRLVWENVGYSLFTWTVVFLCIAFGIKWTGRIVSLYYNEVEVFDLHQRVESKILMNHPTDTHTDLLHNG